MSNPFHISAHKAAYTEIKYTTEEIVEQFAALSLTELKACTYLYQGNYGDCTISVLQNKKVPYGLVCSVSLGAKNTMEVFVSLTPQQVSRLSSEDNNVKAMVMKQLLDYLVESRDAFQEASFTIDSVKTVAVTSAELQELKDLGVQILDEEGNELKDLDRDDNDTITSSVN